MTIPQDLEERIEKCFHLHKNPPLIKEECRYMVLEDQKDTAGHDCYRTEYEVREVIDDKRVSENKKEILEIFDSLEDEKGREKIAGLFEWNETTKKFREFDRARRLFEERGIVPPTNLLKQIYRSCSDRETVMAAGKELDYSRLRIVTSSFLRNTPRRIMYAPSDIKEAIQDAIPDSIKEVWEEYEIGGTLGGLSIAGGIVYLIIAESYGLFPFGR